MMAQTLLASALRGEIIQSIPIIDIHVHLGQWGLLHLPVHDEAMIAKMDRVGVDRICVNGIFYSDTAEGNNHVANFAARYPDRVVPFASVNPFQGDIEDELLRCLNELGCRGIKLHEMVGWGNLRHRLGSPRQYGDKWERVYALAAQHHLPVLYHGIVTEEDIRRFPETIFIQAHGACGLQGEAIKRRFAAYPNLYVDTAQTQNTVWEIAETIAVFGHERVLWGTDAPLDDFAQRLGVILVQPITEDAKACILGGNAMRLLNLT